MTTGDDEAGRPGHDDMHPRTLLDADGVRVTVRGVHADYEQ